MNWRKVANQEVVTKFDGIEKGLQNMLSNLDKSIREIKRTTLLDSKSSAWLDFLESSRQQLKLVLKNKDK